MIENFYIYKNILKKSINLFILSKENIRPARVK